MTQEEIEKEIVARPGYLIYAEWPGVTVEWDSQAALIWAIGHFRAGREVGVSEDYIGYLLILASVRSCGI